MARTRHVELDCLADGTYFDAGRHSAETARADMAQFWRYRWTALLQTSMCARGEYEEELDVFAHTREEARSVAEAALARDYDEGCWVAKVVELGM